MGKYFYHGTYRPHLNSIMKYGLGGKVTQKTYPFSKEGVVYLTDNPLNAESFAATAEDVPDEWLDQVIVLQIDGSKLDPNHLSPDENFRIPEAHCFQYEGVIPPTAIKMYKQASVSITIPLYHVTRQKNVPNILRDGLLPDQDSNWYDPSGVVFLTSKGGLEFWIGKLKEFLEQGIDEDEEPVVLQISPKGLHLRRDSMGSDDAQAPSYTTDFVPPQNIKPLISHKQAFITIPLSAAVTVVEGTGEHAVKTAVSLHELVRQTNAFSKKYRPGCKAALLDSNPHALFLHYNVKCNKEDSDPAGHDVRVQFDVAKVQESQQAKDLDIQVSCSCPAFLYWGAQWNLHQRDGLLGPARPQLQAPTERLDLRGNYVICKHVHSVFERILPSVQHNIINILRKREVDRKKDELDKMPDRLQKEQERMKKKKQIEEIRETKDKELKQKLIDDLKSKEEGRMLHEEELEEQVGPPVEVQRDEPATEEHAAPAPTPAPESAPTPAPRTEGEEFADIGDLQQNEEAKIEQLHKEHKPHVHKRLPYEPEDEELEGEGWKGERLSSVEA